MKILYQRAADRPGDWEQVDSREWARLPTFQICAVCIQGVTFCFYEQYAVAALDDGGVRVTAWTAGKRQGIVWTFGTLMPDRALGGAINTRQSKELFVPRSRAHLFRGGKMIIRAWEDFAPPDHALARQALPIEDQHARHAQYAKARSARGWREWTEGLSVDELDENGHIKIQYDLGRFAKSEHTRRFFLRSTNQATGAHNSDNEDTQDFGTSSAVTEESNNIMGGGANLTHCFTTPIAMGVNWPTGTYRCQLDCSAVGADVSYGLLPQGAQAGHFAQVQVTDVETKVQVESAFTGTGLKLATTGSVSWTANTLTTYECNVAAVNTGAGNQTLTLRLNTADSFSDGPWDEFAVVVMAAVSTNRLSAPHMTRTARMIPSGQGKGRTG